MTSKANVTPEQAALVKRLFQAHKTDVEIAAALTKAGRPMGERRAQDIRQQLGLHRDHAETQRMDVEYVVREFKAANPQTQEEIRRVIAGIAQDVNRGPDATRRVLRKRELIPPRYPELDPAAVARAEELLKSGVPYPEVIKETKISRDRLLKRFPGYAMSQADASVYRHAKKLEEVLL